jgi:hypothetical protein
LLEAAPDGRIGVKMARARGHGRARSRPSNRLRWS